jgi:hypothetical protein
MLQDPERGRPMEIDALLGSVVEFAELTDKPDAIEKANGARPARPAAHTIRCAQFSSAMLSCPGAISRTRNNDGKDRPRR